MQQWLLVLAGVVSIVFGAMVIMFPAAGALAMMWLISFYAVLSGVLLLTFAFRARNWTRERSGISRMQPQH